MVQIRSILVSNSTSRKKLVLVTCLYIIQFQSYSILEIMSFVAKLLSMHIGEYTTIVLPSHTWPQWKSPLQDSDASKTFVHKGCLLAWSFCHPHLAHSWTLTQSIMTVLANYSTMNYAFFHHKLSYVTCHCQWTTYITTGNKLVNFFEDYLWARLNLQIMSFSIALPTTPIL